MATIEQKMSDEQKKSSKKFRYTKKVMGVKKFLGKMGQFEQFLENPGSGLAQCQVFIIAVTDGM